MSKLPRTILHADMDAFYAAVEQRDHPELRGKPVIVGGAGRRGVVSTASYEARRFGVHSAQPGSIARELCPDGIFVAPRMDVYVGVSRQIRSIFEDYTPLVEPLSLDEAFLDVSGSALLFGDGEAIAREIRRRVHAETQLTISIGVASTKYVAKVASDLEKPDGLTVVPRDGERAFLRPLPIKRIWGAGKRTQSRLHELGIRKIGDLQDVGEASLIAMLGESSGRQFWCLANGIDARPVVSERGAKSISHETTFGEDLFGREQASAVLLGLAEGVGSRLRASELVAQTVKLKLRWPPFETVLRQRSLDTPTDDDRVLHRCALELLDKELATTPERGIRLLGLGAAALRSTDEGASQAGLFDEGPDKHKSAQALRAMDSIRERFGKGVIGHGAARAPRREEDAQR